MLTQDEIVEYKNIITSTPSLTLMAQNGDDSGLADALSPLIPKVLKPSANIEEKGIFLLLGIDEGEIFLETVEGLAAGSTKYANLFKRVDRWIKSPAGLDLGLQLTQDTFKLFSQSNGGPFSDSSVSLLLNYGLQTRKLTIEDVASLR